MARYIHSWGSLSSLYLNRHRSTFFLLLLPVNTLKNSFCFFSGLWVCTRFEMFKRKYMVQDGEYCGGGGWWFNLLLCAQPLATTLRAQKLLPPTYEEDHGRLAGWLRQQSNQTRQAYLLIILIWRKSKFFQIFFSRDVSGLLVSL